jgi:Transition state regulatory protein AbrB
VKTLLTLIAVLAGFILAQLGLPASFVTGPLLVAAFFAVTDRPVIRFPLFIYRLAQSVIGLMLSFTITAKSLQIIAANWAPVVTLVITMLVLTTLIGIALHRFANLQPGTALPGGAASPNQRRSHRAVHGAVRGSAIKGAKRARWNIRIMNRPNPIEYRRRLSVDSESNG